MKKVGIVLFALLLLVSFYTFRNFFSSSAIVGSYVNTNYESSVLVDVPRVADTIWLMPENKFKSNFYGIGTYEIKRSITGTRLKWSYQSGNSSHGATISRNWFSKPRIIINPDLNYYYQKVE